MINSKRKGEKYSRPDARQNFGFLLWVGEERREDGDGNDCRDVKSGELTLELIVVDDSLEFLVDAEVFGIHFIFN